VCVCVCVCLSACVSHRVPQVDPMATPEVVDEANLKLGDAVARLNKAQVSCPSPSHFPIEN
jgi:hypothetical protein